MSALGTYDVATACSGGDVQSWAGHAVAGVLTGDVSRFNKLASCDIGREQRLFMLAMTPAELKGKSCMFSLLQDMRNVKAKCDVHKKPGGCEVKVPWSSWIGFSCKGLSLLAGRKTKPVDVIGDSLGTTGETLDATLEYLYVKRPPVYVGEHSPELLETEVYMLLGDKFGAIGYLIRGRVLDGRRYGAVPTRKRAWVIALELVDSDLSADDANAAIMQMFAFLDKLSMTPAALKDPQALNDTSRDDTCVHHPS